MSSNTQDMKFYENKVTITELTTSTALNRNRLSALGS